MFDTCGSAFESRGVVGISVLGGRGKGGKECHWPFGGYCDV